MTSINNRVLLIVSAIVILLLIVGFYLFGVFKKETGGVRVDKLISNPQTREMVDNLGVDDPKYGNESVIDFQLRITNIADVQTARVTVKDVFPQYVDFDKGEGSFDSETRTLTLSIESLNPGEERIINFSGKVSKDLPVSPDILCVENQVDAAVEGGDSAQDAARFCIDKKIAIGEDGFALALSPATGPEALVLFLLIPAGIFGWNLRKHSFSHSRFVL